MPKGGDAHEKYKCRSSGENLDFAPGADQSGAGYERTLHNRCGG